MIYPKSEDVLAATRLRPVATYIRRHIHHIATIIEGRALLEECRGGGEEEREFEPPNVVAAGDEPGGG